MTGENCIGYYFREDLEPYFLRDIKSKSDLLNPPQFAHSCFQLNHFPVSTFTDRPILAPCCVLFVCRTGCASRRRMHYTTGLLRSEFRRVLHFFFVRRCTKCQSMDRTQNAHERNKLTCRAFTVSTVISLCLQTVSSDLRA
jgi:hypothetical protein